MLKRCKFPPLRKTLSFSNSKFLLGVLGIGDGIPDHVLKEHLEDNVRSEYTIRLGKYIIAYLHKKHSDSENISAHVDILNAYVHTAYPHETVYMRNQHGQL